MEVPIEDYIRPVRGVIFRVNNVVKKNLEQKRDSRIALRSAKPAPEQSPVVPEKREEERAEEDMRKEREELNKQIKKFSISKKGVKIEETQLNHFYDLLKQRQFDSQIRLEKNEEKELQRQKKQVKLPKGEEIFNRIVSYAHIGQKKNPKYCYTEKQKFVAEFNQKLCRGEVAFEATKGMRETKVLPVQKKSTPNFHRQRIVI